MRRTKQHTHKHVQVSGGAPAWHWFLKGHCIAWSYAPVPAPPSPVQGCCSECLALQPKPHPGCSCCSLALLVPRLPAPLAPLFFSSMCCSRWLFPFPVFGTSLCRCSTLWCVCLSCSCVCDLKVGGARVLFPQPLTQKKNSGGGAG